MPVMPIFEYECRTCSHRFEQLVIHSTTPTCPRCQGTDLETQISMFAVSSENTRQSNWDSAWKQKEPVRTEKVVEDHRFLHREMKEHSGE
jgi:putative FmdB family regulatory protein